MKLTEIIKIVVLSLIIIAVFSYSGITLYKLLISGNVQAPVTEIPIPQQ